MRHIFQSMFSSYKKLFSVLVVAILVLSLPITLQLVKTQQDLRQRASSVSLSDLNPATGNTYEYDLEENGAGAAVDFYQDNLGGSVPQDVVEALNHIDESGQVPAEYGGSGSSGSGSSGSGVNSQTETSSSQTSQSITMTESAASTQVNEKYINDVNSVRTGSMTTSQFQAVHGSPPPAAPNPNEAGAGQYVVVGGGSAVGTGQYAFKSDGTTKVWVPDSVPDFVKTGTCGGQCIAIPIVAQEAPKPAAAIPSAAPTAPGTPTVSTACAQFSQYCNSSGSCNWGSLPGTSSCNQVVLSYYQTCLQATGTLGPTIQAICGSGTTPPPTGTPIGAHSVVVSLPGIGNAAGGNTNPRRTVRTATVYLLDTLNNQITSTTLTLTYNSASGNFSGTLPLPPSSPYKVRVRLDNTISKIPLQIFTQATSATTPPVLLVTGDLDQDNSISLADYNLMLSCTNSKSTCTSAIKDRADLNDDGAVDSADLAILYRGFQTRQGD